MARVQLRPRHDRSGLVSETTLYAGARVDTGVSRQVTLLDLLDRLLAGGVVIHGHITLAAADIDLVELDLGVLVAAVDKAAGR
jgi:Gas vesicle protein